MNEKKPIMFSDESVRMILRGNKTQSRRVIQPQPPHWRWNDHSWDERCIDVGTGEREDAYYVICPYGKKGDRLWVRETWAHDDLNCEDVRCGNRDHIWWKANEEKIVADSFAGAAHWRSPIFMPRWASRIDLEIVNVRVERVQEISPADAKAEGMSKVWQWNKNRYAKHPEHFVRGVLFPSVANYSVQWDEINAKRGYGWNVNPWVWVIEFKMLDPTPGVCSRGYDMTERGGS